MASIGIGVGIGVTGVAAGTLLVYSNYNPVFKNQVNEKIPGFGSVSDKAAGLWVNTTDYFNSKLPGKSEDKLVFEHNQAKTKPRSDEPKKTQPTQSHSPPTTPQKPQSQSPPTPPSTPQKPSSNDSMKKDEKKATKVEPKGEKGKNEKGKDDTPKTKIETPKGKDPVGKSGVGSPKDPTGKTEVGAPKEKDPAGKSKDGVKEVSKSPTDSVQDSKASQPETSPVPTEGTTGPPLTGTPATPVPPVTPPDSKAVAVRSGIGWISCSHNYEPCCV